MNIYKTDQTFGKQSENKLERASDKSIDGAFACLETFYYAFNHRDAEILNKIWLNDDLVQLNNPLGGIIYGVNAINDLYNKIFTGKTSVWVSFGNINVFDSEHSVTFAGVETGMFTKNEESIDLLIRTTRVFVYNNTVARWYLMHHHGSIDNPLLLEKYQQAVTG